MRTREHILELDGLRGIAVLMVLWVHLGHPLLGIECPHWAWLGVDLFFVLSGFLNTRNLLYNRENGIGMGRFAARRAARIVPAAYLCILLTTLLYGNRDTLFAATYTINFAGVLGKLRTGVYGHYWSLCVEEQFYVIWAVVIAFFSLTFIRRFAWLVLFACPWISLAGVLAIEWYDPEKVNGRWYYAMNHLFTRGWPIWVGSLLAIYEPYFKDKQHKLVQLAIGTALACLAICAFYPAAQQSENLTGAALTFGILGPQLGVVTFFLLVLSQQTRGYFLVLQTNWLRWIGLISYGLYLYHVIFYKLTDREPWQALSLSFLMATVSYYWFELPFMRLERKWEQWRAKQTETVQLEPS